MGIPRVKSIAQREAERQAEELSISTHLSLRQISGMQNIATKEGVPLGLIMARYLRFEAENFRARATKFDKSAAHLEQHPETLKLDLK